MSIYMNKKNKILFLLHQPPPVHGSSIIGRNILQSKKINQKFSCQYINLLASKNIEETGNFKFSKILHTFKLNFLLLHQLLKGKPQLCYIALTVTGYAFFRDFFLIVLLRLFKVKTVYHLHNKGVVKKQEKKTYKLLYSYIFKNTDVILLSEILYEDIKSFVPFSKVHICPNGIEDTLLKNNNHTENKKTKLLFLSNLIESKGVFVLLEACYLLKNKGLEFHCEFVGKEADVSKNIFEKKVIDLSLQDYVRYAGAKYEKKKEEVLSQTDIFVFPTFYEYECFPLVLLEAMSYALPVISTYEGGIPDIINNEKTGFLVPQRNIEILAEKLEILIKDADLRKTMGKAGRKKFEKEFTMLIFEKNILQILNSLCKY